MLRGGGRAYHRGLSVDVDKNDGHWHGLYQQIPTASRLWHQDISWGEPAEIMQAKADKCCPRCGAIRGEGYVDKHGNPILGGFELIFDTADVFGARCLCNNCGFSF